jgi:allantoicase
MSQTLPPPLDLRDPATPVWLDLPDLASDTVGGAAIACNDEFFAEKENLLRLAPAVWKEGEYTDRGKWMDGWETRRRRDGGTADWCVIRLGMPGVIRGIVVDTAWFRGNFPAECAIEACEIDEPLDLAALESAVWVTLVSKRALRGDSKNLFATTSPARFTHVRLTIFPDGGVARLRIHGEVAPRWSRLRGIGGPIDLAALEHGAVVESCSDMFFGSRQNLIKPGPSRSMADGWETRRRRGPGNDWAIIRLAATGTIERLVVDTSHFKGNAPGRIEVHGVNAPGVPADQLYGWRLLLASPAQPHTVHTFDDELRRIGDVTHLRLSVFPCGGVARLRAWGNLAPAIDDAVVGLAALNAMFEDEVTAALLRCCGSPRWAAQIASARPFEDAPSLMRIAEHAWWSLADDDRLQAFAAHPQIGSGGGGASTSHSAAATAWSSDEQRTTALADEQLLSSLAAANQEYLDRFGFIYIVCASGRSAPSMLADLDARIGNTHADELRAAAEEQAKITRLRLAKLLGELGKATP